MANKLHCDESVGNFEVLVVQPIQLKHYLCFRCCHYHCIIDIEYITKYILIGNYSHRILIYPYGNS
jgi:hypothetical protein